jgi:hypothetical protein
MFSHDFYMISTCYHFTILRPGSLLATKAVANWLPRLRVSRRAKQASEPSDEVGFVDENYPLGICYIDMEAMALEIVDLS